MIRSGSREINEKGNAWFEKHHDDERTVYLIQFEGGLHYALGWDAKTYYSFKNEKVIGAILCYIENFTLQVQLLSYGEDPWVFALDVLNFSRREMIELIKNCRVQKIDLRILSKNPLLYNVERLLSFFHADRIGEIQHGFRMPDGSSQDILKWRILV